MEQFDRSGNIVTGKKLSLRAANSGNYLLTVTVSNPSGGGPVFATASFKILGDETPNPGDVAATRNKRRCGQRHFGPAARPLLLKRKARLCWHGLLSVARCN